MSATKPLPVVEFGQVPPSAPNTLPPFPCTFDPEPGPSQVSLASVVAQVNKAKRVAVVCGAGISCASGIPDFRSSGGLFDTLKRQYPEARLNSGKDLFDASLFQSEQNAAIFFTMISELKQMADKAAPTSFHRFLKSLDDQGKLFRVYTQNIDGLEEKVGLTYGLGDKSLPLPPRRAPRSPTKPARMAGPPPTSLSNVTKKAVEMAAKHETTGLPYPSPAPSPPHHDGSLGGVTHAQIPKCIPLHGVLSTMSCAHCSTTEPISPYLTELGQGQAISCPTCQVVEESRTSKGVRSRGVGKLKPDVVLYGEEHKDGERVGEITRRDLMGARPDLLLVVGTSLKVPGTKRLVRELAKVIKPPSKPSTAVEDEEGGNEEEDGDCKMPSASMQSTTSCASTASTGSRSTRSRPPPVHVVYLNYEFPKPSTEWREVFDVWMRGDVQEFVEMVEKDKREAEERTEKRRFEKIERDKRKAAAVAAAQTSEISSAANLPAQPKMSVTVEVAAAKTQKATKAKPTTKKVSNATTMNTLAPSKSSNTGKVRSTGGSGALRILSTKADRLKLESRAASVKSAKSTSSSRASSSRESSVLSSLSTSSVSTRASRSSDSDSGRVTRQQTRLTFNVTKASVASVTGTKG
ncbi:hypothetical protein OIO90_000138 [Microbotryomycetes sp. JL221]|nr:hypothetical protein OIO90_000138 [Microbotryomycetes sp. JL221]